MEKNKQEVAFEFLVSLRGQFIMGQALQVAIEAMESVEPEIRERSNIQDMKFLRDNLFNLGAAISNARKKAAEMVHLLEEQS